MAKESRVAPPLVAPEPIDFRTNEIEGTIAEKSRSRGILLCLSSSSDGHKVDPKELNDIKNKLNDVVEIGAQFYTQQHRPQRQFRNNVISRFTRREATETEIRAKVIINIKGSQVGHNGRPKLLDMGWVLKWKPDQNNDPNYRMQVEFSPTVGHHNLIHDYTPMDVNEEIHAEPHIEAKGLVSAGFGFCSKKKTQTIKRFATFGLAGIPTDGQVKWEWHQTGPGDNVGDQQIRDPQLSYQFGFRFTFRKPDITARRAVESGAQDHLLPPGVEISFCDFEVNFEPEHKFFRSVKLSAPQSELRKFSSRSGAYPTGGALDWPMPETSHDNCSTCRKMLPPPAAVPPDGARPPKVQ